MDETKPQNRSGSAALDWAEVEACTLPTVERPLRLAEFDSLFSTSLRAIDREGRTHARLHLVGADDVAARTQRLADAESACCSFFTFAVTEPAPGEVAFDIEVPDAYVYVLTGLVDRADAAMGSRA